MVGNAPAADRVVLGLEGGPVRSGVPVLVPGVHAFKGRLAGLPAGVGAGEEYVEVLLRAGLRGADGSDHLRAPAMHTGCALRRREASTTRRAIAGRISVTSWATKLPMENPSRSTWPSS